METPIVLDEAGERGERSQGRCAAAWEVRDWKDGLPVRPNDRRLEPFRLRLTSTAALHLQEQEVTGVREAICGAWL